jgi:hypothetical protein
MPTQKQKDPNDSFLDEMEQRINNLRTIESSSSNSNAQKYQQPPTKSSPGISGPVEKRSPSELMSSPFVRKPVLPQEPFFVQLRGFTLAGDLGYFSVIDEGMWVSKNEKINQLININSNLFYFRPCTVSRCAI